MSQRVWFSFFAIILSTRFLVGADLASAKRKYEEKEYDAALKESMALAEEGNADAQVLVGKMYMMGQGIPHRDRDLATKWFKAAAEQGNADGQFFTGSMCLKQDPTQGIKWLRLAADQGMQDAQYLLGKTYLGGILDVPRDLVQAAMWLRLAAKGNMAFYQSGLQTAEAQMTADQRTKAKALADQWSAKRSSASVEAPVFSSGQITAAPTTTAAPIAGAEPIATVDGQPIYERDLLSMAGPQLLELQNQEYQVKMNALHTLIRRKILQAEATRRGLPIEEFLKQEVDSKVPEPSEDEARGYYLATKSQNSLSFEAARPQIQQLLRGIEIQQAREWYADSLQANAKVTVRLPPASVR